MLSWCPRALTLSNPRAIPSTCSDDVARELLLPEHTGVYRIPTPGELGAPPRSETLLAELAELASLRRPLIGRLTRALRCCGMSEQELMALARGVWSHQTHRSDPELELEDIPVPRQRAHLV